MPRPPRDTGSTSTDASKKLEKLKEKVKRKKKEWKKWNKTLHSGKNHRVDSIETLGILYRLVALDVPTSGKHRTERWYDARQEAMDCIQSIQNLSRSAIKYYTGEDDYDDDDDDEDSNDDTDKNNEVSRLSPILKENRLQLWAHKVASFMEKVNKHSGTAMLWLDIEHPHIMQELEQSRRNLRAFANKKPRSPFTNIRLTSTRRGFVVDDDDDVDVNSSRDYDHVTETLRVDLLDREQTDAQIRRETSIREVEAFLQHISELKAREDAQRQDNDNDNQATSAPIVYSITGLRNQSEEEPQDSELSTTDNPASSSPPNAMQAFMSKLKGTYEIKPGMDGFEPEALFNQYLKTNGIEIPEDFSSFEVLPAAGTGTVVGRGTIRLIPRSSIADDNDEDSNDTKTSEESDDATTTSSAHNSSTTKDD
jgi:hypothetical protein